MKTLSERQLAKLRQIIGPYHAETEELVRVLEALEAAGLTLDCSVKQTKRTHDLLEGYLEKLDRGEFGPRDVARIMQQLEDHILQPFNPGLAFEAPKGRAVQQIRKAHAGWLKLNKHVFEKLEVDLPELEAGEVEEPED